VRCGIARSGCGCYRERCGIARSGCGRYRVRCGIARSGCGCAAGCWPGGGWRGRGGALAGQPSVLLRGCLLACVECVFENVLLHDVELLDVGEQLPCAVARVKADAELIETLSFVHAVPVDTDDDAEVARRKLSCCLLCEGSAAHVERFHALDVDLVFVELNEILDVVVIAAFVGA
jgi:hypothetical protein